MSEEAEEAPEGEALEEQILSKTQCQAILDRSTARARALARAEKAKMEEMMMALMEMQMEKQGLKTEYVSTLHQVVEMQR